MAKTEKTASKKKSYLKQIIITLVVLTGPIWGLSLLLFLTSLGTFGTLPSVAQISNPQTKLATEIITEDGEVLGLSLIHI